MWDLVLVSPACPLWGHPLIFSLRAELGVRGRLSASAQKHLCTSRGGSESVVPQSPAPTPKTGALLPPSHHKASSLPRSLLGEVRGVLNGTLLNGTAPLWLKCRGLSGGAEALLSPRVRDFWIKSCPIPRKALPEGVGKNGLVPSPKVPLPRLSPCAQTPPTSASRTSPQAATFSTPALLRV